MNVVIVGLGLIGGSVALAARERLGASIVGVDVASVVGSVRAGEVADRLVDVADADGLRAAARACDLVVVATPVGVIEAAVGGLLEHAPVVTDTGSTKRAVMRAAAKSPRGARFVGSHPMAGRPEGGLEHARSDLFHDRPWIVCGEDSDADAVERVVELARAIGAIVTRLSAEDHDRAVALTSHVPQLLASALAVLAGRRDADAAAGPAFERATRGAGGPAAMWSDIFGTNADEIAAALRELGARLDRAACGLEESPADVREALALLEEARKLREP